MLGTDDARRLGDGAVEHVVEALGARELARELEQGLGTLGFAPLRLVEARVLERNGRVAGEHLEQAQVLFVELVEAELGDDDRADHAHAVVERNGQQRLVDQLRPRNRLSELAVRRVSGEHRGARRDDVARDAVADLHLEHVHRRRRRCREISAECDRHDLVSLDDEHAAVVVVDQRAELVRDRQTDLAHVVEAVQLPGEALKHLQVGDRTHVACSEVAGLRTLMCALAVVHEPVLAARLRGHHRRLGARDQIARVARVVRALGHADRERQAADRSERLRLHALHDPLGEVLGVARVGRRHDHRELLAPEPAHDVASAHGRAQHLRELDEDLVACRVPVHVVRALEVVDVQHQHHGGLVRPARALELRTQALVEVAVVVEAREPVGLRLVLEPRADLRVVERERGGVGEAFCEIELLLREEGLFACAVDVQRAFDRVARDQRDRDERLRLVFRGPRDDLHARVEVRAVRQHRLAMLDRPAGDAFAELHPAAHDLLDVLAGREHREQELIRDVGLVDDDRLVREQPAERVADALEQRVEALLGEHLVEDVGESAVRVDQHLLVDSIGRD